MSESDSAGGGLAQMPKAQRVAQSPSAGSSYFNLTSVDATGPQLLPQEAFLRLLYVEQKRTERSLNPFVLMLIEPKITGAKLTPKVFSGVLTALSESTRETDISGWYSQGSAIGIIFTEIGPDDPQSIANALLVKVTRALSHNVETEESKHLNLSAHFYPEDQSGDVDGLIRRPFHSRDLGNTKSAKEAIKRSMDIAGSLFALVLASPLLLVLSLAVKLTSKGPVLFRQVRVGQYGRPFTFFKFRSMYSGNDPRIHKEYVTRLIAGDKDAAPKQNDAPAVHKIKSDPRVTPMGRLLRRTSLDEVPQFFNVLLGEMSLVGPRPPIPYEVECYEPWHHRRLSVKPGITGLWQVSGRSRVSFDEMVRMDLRYAATWTPWLDLKILLKTPRAVLSGEGAF